MLGLVGRWLTSLAGRPYIFFPIHFFHTQHHDSAVSDNNPDPPGIDSYDGDLAQLFGGAGSA